MAEDLRTSTTSKVSFHVKLRVREDPTGGSIEFGIGTDDETPPSNFAAGTIDTYTAVTGKATATTPTMGSAAAGIDLTSFEPGRLVLWYRITVGAEVVELPWDGGFITLIS